MITEVKLLGRVSIPGFETATVLRPKGQRGKQVEFREAEHGLLVDYSDGETYLIPWAQIGYVRSSSDDDQRRTQQKGTDAQRTPGSGSRARAPERPTPGPA